MPAGPEQLIIEAIRKFDDATPGRHWHDQEAALGDLLELRGQAIGKDPSYRDFRSGRGHGGPLIALWAQAGFDQWGRCRDVHVGAEDFIVRLALERTALQLGSP